MSAILPIIIPILAGIGITLQSSMSGQVSKITSSALFSTLSMYLMCALMMMTVFALFKVDIPKREALIKVPTYLWFLGSAISLISLSLVYWVMPQIGIHKTIVGVIVGQIFTSLLLSYFGAFGLTQDPITLKKLIGSLLLISGSTLIQLK